MAKFTGWEIIFLVSLLVVKKQSKSLQKGCSKNDSKIMRRILYFSKVADWKSSTKEWIDSQAFCRILPKFCKTSMVALLLLLLTFINKSCFFFPLNQSQLSAFLPFKFECSSRSNKKSWRVRYTGTCECGTTPVNRYSPYCPIFVCLHTSKITNKNLLFIDIFLSSVGNNFLLVIVSERLLNVALSFITLDEKG